MLKEKTYHRVKVNKSLLTHKPPYNEDQLKNAVVGQVKTIVPEGICIGIFFNSYTKELDAWSAIDYQQPAPSEENENSRDKAFICSHTDIIIEDSRNRPITYPSDIETYKPKNCGAKGFKVLNKKFENNEQITIEWEAMGDAYPPCGEFIFIIEPICICEQEQE